MSLIETYERHLGELKRLIAAGDAAGIEKQLDQAKYEREQLTPRTSGKS